MFFSAFYFLIYLTLIICKGELYILLKCQRVPTCFRDFWVTPFKIHTPPVEDFGKSVPHGECEFSNVPTFCVIFRFGLSQMEQIFYLEVMVPNRGGLGSQTGRGKILKRPFCPFLSSFFFVSNRPWVAQNQAAHVAIAKTPQRPVRLLCQRCLFTWNIRSPRVKCSLNLPQGCVEFKWSYLFNDSIEEVWLPKVFGWGYRFCLQYLHI